MNSQPTFLFFNQFKLNELWPYYQKHVNQIILNCTTLKSLASQIFEDFNQILLIVKLSLNQTLLMFLFCVRQTWTTQLILAISTLIRKDSSTHMHGLTVYVTEGLPLAQDLSLEKFLQNFTCFRLALLHSVSYSFFFYQSLSLSLCTFLILLHLT